MKEKNRNRGQILHFMVGIIGCLMATNQLKSEICGGYMDSYPLTMDDGNSTIWIACNPNCTLMDGGCKSNNQYTPDPPDEEKICRTDLTAPTGVKCVPNRICVTVTYFKGRAFCGVVQNVCKSGCVDWDTVRSSDTECYSWDSFDVCPGT